MTGEVLRDAEQALERHGAFARIVASGSGDGEADEENDRPTYSVQSTPFDATVRLHPAGGVITYHVTVRAPTLSAAVRGEEVAPVVQEGWLDTFSLRLEDVGGATRADPEPPLVRLDADRGRVVVETAFETGIAAQGADDAKAVVDYVEGTYVEGIVPGYDYGDPVAGLLDRARTGAVDG